MPHRNEAATHLLTPVEYVVETGSTNADIRAAFDAGLRDPKWIVAERQTAGKGRNQRAWQHLDGNFAGTLLWPIAMGDLRCPAAISFLVSLAVGETAESLGLDGHKIGLKWPNDVQISGAKFAGILIEALGTGRSDSNGLVIGLGANLVAAPQDLSYDCAALVDHVSEAPTPQSWLVAFDSIFRARWREFKADGFGPIRSAWLKRAVGIGGPVNVDTGGAVVSGIFLGIDEGGAVIIRATDGDRRIVAGDLSLRRV